MTDTSTLPTSDGGDPAAEARATEAPSAFRWRLASRPDVRFGHAAGGAAGILAAVAVVAFVAEVTDDDATLPGVGFNLLLIAIALAAGFRLRGPVRSAAVAAIAIAIPQVWSFAIAGDGDGIERGDFRFILLLSVVAYVLFYLLTWTRGRAVFLGLALFFGANWVVFEVANQQVPFALGVVDQAQSRGVDDPSGLFTDDGDKTTETGIANLAIAVGLLGAGVALDRKRRAGAATPCLLVGGLYAVNAAITLGIDVDDVYATGVFVISAGLAIGLAGSLGRRRGTSWIGSLVLLAGVLTVVARGTQDAVGGDDGTEAVFGAFSLAGAVVLLVAGVLVARALDEPVDGGEPFTPRPRAPQPEASAPPAEPEPTPEPSPEPTPEPEPATEPPSPPAPAAPPAVEEDSPAVSWRPEPPADIPPDAPSEDAPPS